METKGPTKLHMLKQAKMVTLSLSKPSYAPTETLASLLDHEQYLPAAVDGISVNWSYPLSNCPPLYVSTEAFFP